LLFVVFTCLYSQNSDETLSLKITPGLEDTISVLNYKNTDLRDIINSIAELHNLNIIIENDLDLQVSLRLSNITFYNLLLYLAKEYNLVLEQTGNIIKIKQKELPPPPPKEYDVYYQNDTLRLDLKNEEIHAVMHVIAERSGKTIMLERNISGHISGYIQSQPFDITLRYLAELNGFLLDKKDNIYIIKRDPMVVADGDGKSIGTRGRYYFDVKDSLLTLEVTERPLDQIIEEAAIRLNKDLFIHDNKNLAARKISARLSNVTFTQLLDFLFQGGDLTYKIQNKVYVIGDGTTQGLSSSELIKLSYLKSEDVEKMIPESMMEKDADYQFISDLNGIMVKGTRSRINEMKEYVAQIDRPSPQILIEALVIDFNTTKLRDLSLKAGYSKSVDSMRTGRTDQLLPGLDLLFSGKQINKFMDDAGNYFGFKKIGKLPDDFYLQVKALEQQNYAKVQSRPQIATLNGNEASISIGQTQYYKMKTRSPYGYSGYGSGYNPFYNQSGQTTQDQQQQQSNYMMPFISETETFVPIQANIMLTITPWVSATGEITTEIHPDFKTPVGQLSPEVPPTIQSRELKSTVRLRDGETIVLGGLIQHRLSETVEGLPILQHLPFIGGFFRTKNYSQENSELIIYITPHLYYLDE
jgi:type IV pilus assembly protein PilQ